MEEKFGLVIDSRNLLMHTSKDENFYKSKERLKNFFYIFLKTSESIREHDSAPEERFFSFLNILPLFENGSKLRISLLISTKDIGDHVLLEKNKRQIKNKLKIIEEEISSINSKLGEDIVDKEFFKNMLNTLGKK